MQSDRRQFLKNSLGVSAAVSAAPMIVPRRAWGANDRPAYALIAAALIGGTDLYAYILQSGTATSSPEGWEGACWVSSGNLTLAGTNTQQKGDWTIKGRGALAAI